MSLADLLIDPLQHDVVLVRHWVVVCAPSANHTHTLSCVQQDYRLATETEMGAHIVRSSSLSLYFYARLPCTGPEQWDEARYLRAASALAHPGTICTSAGVRDPILGRVDKETWSRTRGRRGFTVRDVARICADRYLPWHLPPCPSVFAPLMHVPREHAIDVADVKTRALALAWCPLLEGYIFDAVHMPGHSYP
jgi:hypothetical protein